jgi:transcriptional regulator with XRE-family HTH domain
MNDWQYIERKNVQKKSGDNRLKEIRISLGMTITALSKKANVSTKVISQTERMLTIPTQVTKHKIIKGLNIGQLSAEKKWKYEEIFPDDER